MNSFSQIQTLFIRGIVIYVDDLKNVLSDSISIGDSIVGEIKYNLNNTDNNALVQVGDYWDTNSPSGIIVTIKNHIFQTDTNNINLLLETVNNYYDLDNIVFHSYNNLISPSIAGLSQTHISWQLDDTNQTALTNTDIPTCINLNAWQQPFALTIACNDTISHIDSSIFIRSLITNVYGCDPITSLINMSHIETSVIFPNPFNFATTIQWDTEIIDGELYIYNILGENVKSIKHFSGDKLKIYKDNLQNGVYLIRILQDNKTIIIDKLIITD